MPSEEKPLGKLFSELYVERGELKSDSERMRRRALYLFVDALRLEKPTTYGFEFSKLIERRLGISGPHGKGWRTDYVGSWETYLLALRASDFLDVLTLMLGSRLIDFQSQ